MRTVRLLATGCRRGFATQRIPKTESSLRNTELARAKTTRKQRETLQRTVCCCETAIVASRQTELAVRRDGRRLIAKVLHARRAVVDRIEELQLV
jgi:phage shock protein A